jgi:acid phosphatase class B
MTIGVTPRLRARLEDPLTSHSAPKYSSTNPTRQYTIYRTIASVSFQIFRRDHRKDIKACQGNIVKNIKSLRAAPTFYNTLYEKQMNIGPY